MFAVDTRTYVTRVTQCTVVKFSFLLSQYKIKTIPLNESHTLSYDAINTIIVNY